MGHDLAVTDLVTRAQDGDQQAWNALVEQYAPLIWSICRRYRLSGADAEDAAQAVWLRLVDKLDKIRNPAAIAGWLATTTRRECCRVLRAPWRPQAAWPAPDAETVPDQQARTAEHELLAAERHAALREALAQLTPREQQLIAILTADPPVSYAEISARLGIPVGSIGPSRGRCLDKLRRHPAIAALISAETQAEAPRRYVAGQPAVMVSLRPGPRSDVGGASSQGGGRDRHAVPPRRPDAVARRRDPSAGHRGPTGCLRLTGTAPDVSSVPMPRRGCCQEFAAREQDS